jgi:hypothetical protein
MALQSFVAPWLLFQFPKPIHNRGISSSQGRYLHTDTRALSGIRTHDPSVLASEDSSCLKPRSHCDRQASMLVMINSTVRRKSEQNM